MPKRARFAVVSSYTRHSATSVPESFAVHNAEPTRRLSAQTEWPTITAWSPTISTCCIGRLQQCALGRKMGSQIPRDGSKEPEQKTIPPARIAGLW